MANIKKADSEFKRLVIYDIGKGVYLFSYDKMEDTSSLWNESLSDVIEACEDKYRVKRNEWIETSGLLQNCQTIG